MYLRLVSFTFCMILIIFMSLKPLFAGSNQHNFNIYVSGLKIGELTFAVNTKGSNYAVRGIIKATGLFGAIAKFHLDATAFGKVHEGSYHTQKYSEIANKGKRVSTKKMIFKNGIPNLTYSEPLKDYWAKPSEQQGTVDPMTAIMVLLSDKSKEPKCGLAMNVYDGVRRFSIRLSEKITLGEKHICKGMYTKIDGYSKKEWSQGGGFLFELNYISVDDNYQVERLIMATKRGRTSFIRR